jgi:YD repeat-containing protein
LPCGVPIIVSIQRGPNPAASYSYDGASNLTEVVDANGGVWNYTYDSQHEMTSITDPKGIVYLQKFNQLASVTDPLQHSTTFNYDPTTGNLTGAIDALSHGPILGYNAAGQVTSMTDATGQKQPADQVLIPTTPQQDAEIQTFIDNISKDPGGYSLTGRHCTSFVKGALDAGSTGPGDSVLAPFVPIDPRSLMYFLHQTYPSK